MHNCPQFRPLRRHAHDCRFRAPHRIGPFEPSETRLFILAIWLSHIGRLLPSLAVVQSAGGISRGGVRGCYGEPVHVRGRGSRPRAGEMPERGDVGYNLCADCHAKAKDALETQKVFPDESF